MGLSIGSLKPTNTIIYNGDPYTILDCEHAKLARGSAFCRVKLKNLKTSQIRNATLRDSDNIKAAFIEKRKLQYLYNSGNHYHFLDLETYEDLVLHKSHITDKIIWFKDNLELSGIFYEHTLLDLELPFSLDLKVVKTDPGFRGNTVKTGTKQAKLETGLKVNVPLFISSNEIIKVNTRTGQYLGRA